MRLWSLHPKYLDTKGMVALWREGLLAQIVLGGETKGYRNHPQLIRFRESRKPMEMIGIYLSHVAHEAEERGYRFDQSKILHGGLGKISRLSVSSGQIDYELQHLLKKLKIRDVEKFKALKKCQRLQVHPLFKRVRGNVADWERV